MRRVLVLFFVSMIALSGCGYTTKSLFAPHLKTIYIDNFDNKIDLTREKAYGEDYNIYRPGLETDLTKAVKNRFMFDGALKVVNSKEEADSILSCEIMSFKKEPLQYRDDKRVTEYRMQVIINMKFTDLINNEVLIDENSFVGETTYTLEGAFTKSESGAEKDAVDDLARRIVERVVEGW